MGEIEALTSVLTHQIPAAQITTDSETLRHNAIDGLSPHLIVTPGSVEEMAQAVSLTNQHNLTLLACGGGSRMNLGGLTPQVDILLKTKKLNRLLEHEGPDLTCHVEAGITLAALQERLATKGQHLALDPPDAAQASLGGILASNASGPKRLRYGTARDLVIGLQVIQANGEIARSGGRVVKNVAGYDLNKLYIGSLGTLGIIAEANFKLHPLPKAEHTLFLAYTSAENAMHTVVSTLGSQLTPSALELIDAKAASDMAEFFDFNIPPNGYILAIDFEGSPATIERQVDEVQRLAHVNNALIGNNLQGGEQERFWNIVRKHTQGTLTCKVSILVSQIASYLQHVKQLCRRHDLEAAIVSHAGNGILYIELQPDNATPRLVAAISELRRHAQEARGSLIVERCPTELKRFISIWGEPGVDFRMMQLLKRQFDPKGTFASGRFLGGI